MNSALRDAGVFLCRSAEFSSTITLEQRDVYQFMSRIHYGGTQAFMKKVSNQDVGPHDLLWEQQNVHAGEYRLP